jgi:hypothetical protein
VTEYTPADLEADVRELVALEAQRAEIVAEADEIKARIRSHLEVGAQVEVDGRQVLSIQPNRRLDVDAAVALLPAEVLPLVQTLTVDPKKVRQYLAPALVERCMVEAGQPKVVLAR